ncbi:hypothetical protein LINPERHAP1_LOCUS20672 [Linum perenne]
MELDNGLFLMKTEFASLDSWSQVVDPPQPATLTASLKSCNNNTVRVIGI